MKVVILCGGRGLRLKELTEDIPKPLAPIRGKPILFHIMNYYCSFGFNEFILLLGYKGEKIKEYFWNYGWKNSNFILDTSSGAQNVQLLESLPNWKITFLDTGPDTMTGARVKMA